VGRRLLPALVRRRGRGWTRQEWDADLWPLAGAGLRDHWPAAEPLRDELWRAGIRFRAGDVPWTPEALEVVADAARRITARFGGDARLLLGGLLLVLEARTEPWWAPLWRLWNRKPAGFAFGGYQYRGQIHLRADNVRLVAVVHEMGHYLDQKHRLSRAYRRHLRAAGLTLVTNRFEDLANALAAHVLDRPLDPVRQAYVERLAWRGSRPRSEAG
jgi:hypothetical protein